jgi:hypothetical protein
LDERGVEQREATDTTGNDNNGRKRKDVAGNAGFPSIPKEDEINEGFDLKPAHAKDQKEGKIG